MNNKFWKHGKSDLNTCDKIDESEKMAENNEIQELIKKAVTSKSLEVLTEAEAQILVDSQTCRPGMISFNPRIGHTVWLMCRDVINIKRLILKLQKSNLARKLQTGR